MQQYSLLFLGVMILLLIAACRPKEQQQLPTVEELVAQRLQAFRKERTKECYEGIIKEANRLVDSTLLANAKSKKAFATIKPPIPDKPVKPDPLPPIDSAEIKPILDLSAGEQDSLNLVQDSIVPPPPVPEDSLKRNTKGEDF